ncbi:unnamed protein product [Triticum turgidum subsp. durum]|uniref:Uncharacterized protein n=1 Tax=Triticum turgidum subsp. durum TaxID=4567 RepID=A0A9R0YU59_TRITD|nr:unnamed protein product [Triticum turgidum subsp. durum]
MKFVQENDTARMSIYIENIHKGIHGSDSGAYDSQGRFVPEKFEAAFAKHAKTVPDALTSAEVDELITANREPSDYAGWRARRRSGSCCTASARTRTGSSARTPPGASTTAASSPGWCRSGGHL